MIERNITILNELGIHARPASLIVQTALKFKAAISIEKDGAVADAKSIMSVMMLAAGKDSTVKIRASGHDEDRAIDTLIRVFESKFNET